MSYYLAGDYYRGSRGDFFGAIGGAIGKAVQVFRPAISAVAKLSPIGALISGAAGIVSRIPTPAGGFPLMPKGFSTGRPVPFTNVGFAGGGCGPGFHLAKSGSGRCARNRSMNPANPTALRRAIRREQAFVVLARRVLKGTGITIGRRSFGKKIGRKR